MIPKKKKRPARKPAKIKRSPKTPAKQSLIAKAMVPPPGPINGSY